MTKTQQTLTDLLAKYTYSKFTLTQMQKALPGSAGEKERKRLGLNKASTRAEIQAAINKEGIPPVIVVPPPVVVVPPPVVVVPPPVTGTLRNLFNEDKLSNGWTVQNSKRPGTTQTDDKGYFRFELLANDKRPTEASGSKRRSEISSLKAAAPSGGKIQVFSGEVKLSPQPFLDNMQWVLAQRHGAPKTGHPEVAFRVEKGGFVILSTCSSPTVESIDIRAKNPDGSKRLMPIGVWCKVDIKDFGNKVELWINGELWVTSNNPANYDGEGQPYYKFGVYNSQGSKEITVVEWRNVTLVTQ